MINRWDFTIDEIDFVINHIKTILHMDQTAFEQSKIISLNNMKIIIDGKNSWFLWSLYFKLKKPNIDYYKPIEDSINVQWNSNDASLSNEIVISNLTVSNSVSRRVSQTSSFMYFSGNSNFN